MKRSSSRGGAESVRLTEGSRIWLPKKVYHAGETIRGKLLLNITEVTRVSSIQVAFEGSEKGFLRYFYVAALETLFGNPDPTKEKDKEHGSQILEVGEYSYDFKFDLPEELPFTMEESKFCRVYFEVIATIHTPLGKTNLSEEFIVDPLGFYDLSKLQTVTKDDKKKNGLTLMATTETNHCLGDKIHIIVKVRKSETKKYTLKDVTTKLLERRYRKTSDTRDEFFTLLGENVIDMKTFQNDQYLEEEVVFQVPFSVLHSSFTKLGLFSVFHEIEVTLNIKWRPNLKIIIPINIFPARYYPNRIILKNTVKNLVDAYERANGKNRPVEELTALIIDRFPAIGADVFLEYVCDVLKDDRSLHKRKILSLFLLDKCSKALGEKIADFFPITHYESTLKRLVLIKKENHGLGASLDMPEFSNSDVGSGETVPDLIMTLIRRWALHSQKWKDGPLHELVKREHGSMDRLSFIAKGGEETAPIDLEHLQIPRFMKIFLTETLKNVSFLGKLKDSTDHPADVSEIADYIVEQLEESLIQLRKIVAVYETDKTKSSSIVRSIQNSMETWFIELIIADSLEFVYKKVKVILNKNEDVTLSVSISLAETDSTMNTSTPREQNKILDILNKEMPKNGLITMTYWTSSYQLLCLHHATRFPIRGTPIALIDLSVNSSGKYGMLFGLDGIYFHNKEKSKQPGRGFISWKNFSDAKIKSFDDELAIGDQYIDVSDRKMELDDLLNILEVLQAESAYFEEKRYTQRDLQKSESSEKPEIPAKPSQAQLINFDDL